MKRKGKVASTLFVYLLYYFLANFDLVTQNVTAVDYLIQLEVKDVSFWHGAIFMIAATFGFIIGLWIARICDRYRCARRILIVLSLIASLGCFVYSIPKSVVNLIVGRLMFGFFLAGFPIINGEVARIVKREQISSSLFLLNIGASFGVACGTLTCSLTKDMDLLLLGIHIRFTNATMLLQGIFLLVFLLLSKLCVYDSDEIEPEDKIYDMEGLLEQKQIDQVANSKGGEGYALPPMRRTLEMLFFNFDIALIYFCTFIYNWILKGSYALVPLVTKHLYDYLPSDTSGIFMFAAFCFLVVSLLFMYLSRRVSDYVLLVVMATISMLSPLLIIFMYIMKDADYDQVSKIAAYGWVSISLTVELCEKVFFRSLLAKFLPAELQSFAEAVRTIFMSSAITVAGIFTSVWFHNIFIVSGTIPFILALTLSLFIARGHSLRYPKVIKV